MPATATGRGAQVIIDPGSATGRAIRGAYAPTLEGNIAKVALDKLIGKQASGETSDGVPAPGIIATDFVTAPTSASGVARLLYVNGVSASNGADTTIDTLMTYDIPANTLRNPGDTIRIFAGGTMIGSSDSRVARITFGNTNVANPGGTGASLTAWSAQVVVTLQANGTQLSSVSLNALANSNINGLSAQVLTKTLTAPITVAVTGQNATNPVAGSVTCQLLMIEFLPAPVAP